MNNLVKAILLTISPISELRGGIFFAIKNGINPWLAFLILTLINILIMFPIFFFLDNLHHYFIKNRIYSKLFNKYIEKSRKKIERYVGTKLEFVILMLFVALPSPGTGCYTGSLLAWFFNLKRKKAYLAIALGVIIAGIIVTLFSLGFFNFIK